MARRIAVPATPRRPAPRVRDVKPRIQKPADVVDDLETPTKRRRPGRIDIDLAMEMERAAAARAMKVVMEAKKQERNLKRRSQRLLKKASGLSAEDLERIALLKRCGLQPTGEEADVPHGIPMVASEQPSNQVMAHDEAVPGDSRGDASGDHPSAAASVSATSMLPPPEGEPRGSATADEEEADA